MGASQRPRGDPEAERRLIDHLDETLFQRKTAKLSAGDESPPKRDPVKGASSVRFLLRRLAVPPLEAPETRPSFPCPPAQPGRIGEQTMNNTKILTNGIIAGGIALFASLAPAAQNTKQQGYLNINGVGLSYTIKDGKASIDNCTLVLHNNGTTSFSGVLSIPSVLDGFPVSCIGNDAFFGFDKLAVVSLPDTICEIGENAFRNCSNLVSVRLSKGISTIRESAFSGCGSLTSITIPEGIQTIGKGSFSFCGELKSVIISEGASTIGDSAFSFCRKLSSIEIPNTVTFIGESAFERCESLVNIGLPGMIEHIGNKAFFGCVHLKTIRLSGEFTHKAIVEDAVKNSMGLRAHKVSVVSIEEQNSDNGSLGDEANVEETRSLYERITDIDNLPLTITIVLGSVVALFFSVIGMRAAGLLFGSDLDFNPIKHPILYVLLFPIWVLAGLFAMSSVKRMVQN